MKMPRCGRGESATAVLRKAACVVAGFLLSGCYTYAPTHGPGPTRGSHVALRLSSDASRELALELGPGVSYVEGVVVADDSAGLHVAISRVEGREALETSWVGEEFTFPHSTYLTLEERHLSVPGTLFVGGLAVGAVFALTEAFNSEGAVNTPGGSGVQPSQ